MFPGKKISFAEGSMFIVCVMILTILIIIEFNTHCLTDKYPLTFAIITNFLSGVLSAIALLYFQELHHIRRINKYYADIAGEYTRVDIGQDNAAEKEIRIMREQNNFLPVILKHIKGTHMLKLRAEYWRSEEALVEASIEFNEKNGTTAYGRYRYSKAKGTLFGHSGTYKIYRLEEDKTKLLVLFHQLFPRQLENNPDANRGWEIWQKK
jgi:hypothetical protein